jgi:hypothetical protein
MTTKQLIEEIRSITVHNINLVQKKLNYLNENQKAWKQSDSSWNINEILAHLNEYARFYHSTFLNRMEKTRFRQPRDFFVPSPLGRAAWKSMKLGNAKNIKRKYKAPKTYNPSVDISLLTGNEVKDFAERQEEFLSIIEKAERVNLRKVKVPISLSNIVRFRLGDALLFVAYHNERHVQQVVNVMASPQFPKK